MSIISIVMDFTGEVQVEPRLGRMVSTDSLDAVLTPGYLNQAPSFIGSPFRPTDFLMTSYDYPEFPTQITLGVTIDNDGIISLSLPPGTGNVISESSSDNNGLVVFSGSSGTLIDQYSGTGSVYVTSGVVSTYPITSEGRDFVNLPTVLEMQHFLELQGAADTLAGYGPTGDLANIGLGVGLSVDVSGDLIVTDDFPIDELTNSNGQVWLADNLSTGFVNVPSINGSQGGRLSIGNGSASGGQIRLSAKTGSPSDIVLQAGTDVGGATIQLYSPNASNVLIGPANNGSGSVSFNFPPNTGPINYLISGSGTAQSAWIPNGARYVQIYTINNVAGLNIPIPSGIQIYELEFKALSTATNDTLTFFASNDGGSSFVVPISYATFGYVNGAGPFVSGGSAASPANITGTAGANLSSLGVSGTMKLWAFGSKVEFIVDLTWQSAGGSGIACRQVTNGSIQGGGVNMLRFEMSSTNLSTGSILVYARES